MLKKIITIFSFSLFLYGCEFQPIYKQNINNKININIINTLGDSSINSLITSNLKRFSNNSSSKEYEIDITSNYIKSELSRDTTGKVTNYRGTISVIFNIKFKDQEIKKNLKYEKNYNIKNTLNSFEQLNYENNIKKNLTLSIVDEFLKDILLI